MKPRLVHVVWQDACAAPSAWQDPDELVNDNPIEVVTVGYLLRKTRKKLVLAASMTSSGAVGESIIIPTPWAAKVSYLKQPRKKRRCK